MNTTPLVERIQRLEDIEAIKNLMARYAFHTNKGWNGQVVDVGAMPSIFAEDIQYVSKDFKELSAVGLEQGMKVLLEITKQIDFSMHSFTNPVITVNGDRATGNWLLWIVSKAGSTTRQVFSSEDVTYVRTAQGWRIQTIDFHVGMALNSEQGRQPNAGNGGRPVTAAAKGQD